MASSILARVGRGALGGVVATLAMSSVLYGAKKAGLLGEPPPRKITRALLHTAGLRPRRKALNVTSMAAHFGFGAGAGAIYGALQPGRVQAPVALGLGAAYGAIVWATSYAGWVPSLNIMAPPSRDRAGRPTSMLAAHFVYGTVLAEVVNAMQPRVAEVVANR